MSSCDRELLIQNDELTIEFAPSGEIDAITFSDMAVNQYRAGIHDVAAGFVALRAHDGSSLYLMGARSNATFGINRDSATWCGEASGVRWTVTLSLSRGEAGWCWRIRLSDDVPGRTWQLVAAQDVALAPVALADSSEPFVSQYVAHRIVQSPRCGSTIVSRQTMAYAPRMPELRFLFVEGATWYATDGFDVYGVAARADAAVHGLDGPPRVLQYEMAMPALMSQPFSAFGGCTRHIVCILHNDSPNSEGVEDDYREAEKMCAAADALQPAPTAVAPVSLLARAPFLSARFLNADELVVRTGGKLFPEYDEHGELASVFAPDSTHGVSGAKELYVERSHGMVIRSGAPQHGDILSATVYAPGVFLSHLALGNTNLNRLVSVYKNTLGIQRNAGLRLFIREKDGQWRLLGVPSAFIMSPGSAQWVYTWGGGTVVVRTVTDPESPRVRIRIESSKPLDILGSVRAETNTQWDLGCDPHRISLRPAADTPVSSTYPQLQIAFHAVGATWGSDAALFDDGVARDRYTVSLYAAQTTQVDLAVAGSLASSQLDSMIGQTFSADIERWRQLHREQISEFTAGAHMSGTPHFDELQVLVPWLVDNALTHVLTPHGLEQYSGAAWGTRDVCQGPLELALAYGHTAYAKDIVMRVLARETRTGELPQWFMPDKYVDVYQAEAHGDIVIWPLLAVAEYLEVSGDTAFLSVEVPYWDAKGDSATVREHLEAIVELLERRVVPGRHLPAYDGGDWDDSLQPVLPELPRLMTSAWTAALEIQSLRMLAEQITEAAPQLALRCTALADQLAAEFHADLMPDGVTAGFAIAQGDGNGPMRPVIHPRDRASQMTYRLIPMTRGIIAGIYTPEEAVAHESIIEYHLHYSDGVRLEDHPAPWDGGVAHFFRRAEQAANVGREIGLMYTHAHLRYVEALTVLGRGRALEQILIASPVQPSRVAAAQPRQRNCYFSSSDAGFETRDEAAARWEELRSGNVPVRGGWRVYSSGPGIFVKILMQGILGIRVGADSVTFDPVLSADDDGAVFRCSLFGRVREIHYHVSERDTLDIRAGGQHLCGTRVEGRYRARGLRIAAHDLQDASRIDIDVPAAHD